MLSKVYKCPFIEVSSLLSMNIETLWLETLCKIQKQKIAREKALEQGFITIDDDPETVAAAITSLSKQHRNLNTSRIVGRIMNRTRIFAKSCEELVARIVAL